MSIDPLRVGRVVRRDGAEVGITLMPGRKDLKRGHDRDLTRDLEDLAGGGFDTMLLTARDEELASSRVADLIPRARDSGLLVIRRPLVRRRLPSLTALASLAGVVEELTGVYSRSVVVICPTGLGRSCLVVAAWLVVTGSDPDEAVTAVRGARGPKALGWAPQLRSLRWLALRAGDPGKVAGGNWPALIANEDLTLDALPAPDAPWYDEINYFALSFDGYHYAGGASFAMWEATVDHLRHFKRLPEALTLSDLRAILFLEQRQERIAAQERDPGEDWPPAEVTARAHLVIDAMRRRLGA